MLTTTGTVMISTALAVNAFGLAEPALPRATIAAGLKAAQCAIPARQAKIVGSEWLGQGLQIVEVSCQRSAQGYNSILFAVPTDFPARSSLIAVEDWRGGRIVTGHRVIAADYERDTRTLRSTENKRSAGDCGSIKEWKWTGWSFRLMHVWNKSTCDGEPFEWDTRERWQVFPKPDQAERHAPAGFSGPSPEKCPPRCNSHNRARLGRPTSAQMAKNHTQPVAAAMKPAPDDK
jgi:hypothetical protein